MVVIEHRLALLGIAPLYVVPGDLHPEDRRAVVVGLVSVLGMWVDGQPVPLFCFRMGCN